MVNGEKAIPAEHCKAIEAFSDGVVTCQEMRPTDWHKYWPELAQTTPQDASQTAKAA
jgi:DNA-binding transcriptional regulator YdaS (Cro superfamily)